MLLAHCKTLWAVQSEGLSNLLPDPSPRNAWCLVVQVTYVPPITVHDAHGKELSYFFVNATILCGRFEVGSAVKHISKVSCMYR